MDLLYVFLTGAARWDNRWSFCYTYPMNNQTPSFQLTSQIAAQWMDHMGWPRKRPLGNQGHMRWERLVEPHMTWVGSEGRICAQLYWCKKEMRAVTVHESGQNPARTLLHARWARLPNGYLELVEFEHNGQEQQLCSRTALNRFYGHTTLINTAPRWSQHAVS